MAHFSIGLVPVLLVAAVLFVSALFGAGYRREAGARLIAVPLALAGAGLAVAGVSRYAVAGAGRLSGQELAIVLAIAALALVALGIGLIGREETK